MTAIAGQWGMGGATAAIGGCLGFNELSALNRLYTTILEAASDPPTAEQRAQLLELATRIEQLLDGTDVFLQMCREEIELVEDTPEFKERVAKLMAKEEFASHVIGGDAVEAATTGLDNGRQLIANEREQMAQDLGHLRARQRPPRGEVLFLSSDTWAQIGTAIGVAGTALAAGALLAPKTAGASAVVAVTVAAAVMIDTGVAIVASAAAGLI